MRWRMARVLDRPDSTVGFMSLEIAGTYRTIYTLELPWRENRRSISRIPEGVYSLSQVPDRDRLRLHAPEHGVGPDDSFERFAVDMHVANSVSELLGCLAVGYWLGWEAGGVPCLGSSGEAMADLLILFHREERVFLEVEDRF